MSAPPPYVVFNDYSDYQTSHQLPGPALQGSDLDVEFNRLKATTDALINNLNLLQRSDGALNNQLVTPDTISSALAIMIAGWNIRGAWVTATAYALKDYVTQAGNGYVCIVAHTAGTFATDLAAGKWALVATAGATGPVGPTGPQGPAGVMPPLRGYLSGLITSNDVTTPNTKIDVSAGMCADDTNITILNVAAPLVIDATIVGANGLDFSSLVLSTGYHIFIIGKVDGTTAGIISTNPTTPIMPSGYTLKRRIGSVKTDASVHFLAFIQIGDYFEWKAPTLGDYNVANPGSSAVTVTLSVPTGIVVSALVNIVMLSGETANVTIGAFSSLASTDTAPTTTPPGYFHTPYICNATGALSNWGGEMTIVTNTLGQIRARIAFSSSNIRLTIGTIGWYDTRGKNS